MRKSSLAFGMLVFVAVVSTASAQINFADNFDDGNIDGWSVFDPISFATGEPHVEVTFEEGTVRLNGPPHPQFGAGLGSLFRPELLFTDFDMSVDVVENNNSVGGVSCLGARVQSPFVGYFLCFGEVDPETAPEPRPFTLSLSRNDGPPGEDGQLPVTFIQELYVDEMPIEGVRLAFRGEGDQLTGELYSLDDPGTLLFSVGGQDSTYVGGYGEFISLGASPPPPAPIATDTFGNARFDNFSLSGVPVPEPSSAVLGLLSIGLSSCLRQRRV